MEMIVLTEKVSDLLPTIRQFVWPVVWIIGVAKLSINWWTIKIFRFSVEEVGNGSKDMLNGFNKLRIPVRFLMMTCDVNY